MKLQPRNEKASSSAKTEDDWRPGPDLRVADPAVAALSLGGLARKP